QDLQSLSESKLSDIRMAREMLAEYKTSKDYEAHLAEVRKKEIAFRVWQEVEKTSVEHQAFMVKKSSYEEVLSAVADVARRMGIDVVLYSRSGSPSSYGVNNVKDLTVWITSQSVVYFSPQTDITDAVIKALDVAK
ncbi:MAG: OmpH family outer membrane protein, partial [Planctomycetes bacterium]|nr:OmpH family outer membrane protein [Planctomycetota bacterium]